MQCVFISSRFKSLCRCRKKIRILNFATKQGVSKSSSNLEFGLRCKTPRWRDPPGLQPSSLHGYSPCHPVGKTSNVRTTARRWRRFGLARGKPNAGTRAQATPLAGSSDRPLCRVHVHYLQPTGHGQSGSGTAADKSH